MCPVQALGERSPSPDQNVEPPSPRPGITQGAAFHTPEAVPPDTTTFTTPPVLATPRHRATVGLEGFGLPEELVKVGDCEFSFALSHVASGAYDAGHRPRVGRPL